MSHENCRLCTLHTVLPYWACNCRWTIWFRWSGPGFLKIGQINENDRNRPDVKNAMARLWTWQNSPCVNSKLWGFKFFFFSFKLYTVHVLLSSSIQYPWRKPSTDNILQLGLGRVYFTTSDNIFTVLKSIYNHEIMHLVGTGTYRRKIILQVSAKEALTQNFVKFTH